MSLKNKFSYDDLISKKAKSISDHINDFANKASNEAEIRIEVEKQLALLQKDFGIKLVGRHEFTVASGSIDSVYNTVIIEYKNPKNSASRLGPNLDYPGCKKVIEQIKSRFYDMHNIHGQPLNKLLGVGLDGKYFIFIRFQDDKWHIKDP